MQPVISSTLSGSDHRKTGPGHEQGSRAAAGPAAAGIAAAEAPAFDLVLSDHSRRTSARQTDNSAAARLLQQVASGADKSRSELISSQKNEAVESLQQARKNLRADRKAAARQRLEAARAKLQMLKIYGGDPQAIARQAKLIAREIQAAAREYGAALKAEGGSGDAATELPSPVPTSNSSAGPDPADQTGSNTEEASQTGASAHGADAKRHTSRSDKDHKTEPTSPDDEQRDIAAEMRQSLVDYAKSFVNAVLGKSNASSEEQDVLNAFRQAARDVRQLIADSIRRIKAEDPEKEDFTRTLRGIDDDVAKLGEAMRTAGAPVSTPTIPVIHVDIRI